MRRVSHYILQERLGSGTYGEVFRAVHEHDPEIQVAVKLVHPALAGDPYFLDALRRECRALARMQHANVVGFRDLVIATEHPPALMMELLEGEDLHARLERGALTVEASADVLDQLLQGLAYAHGKGVVHRDLKPGNTFLCRDGTVKLLDFGVARAADGSRATQTGVVTGTLAYTSLEAFLGGPMGPTCDVYAAGLLAWELVTGRAACPDGMVAARMGWHLSTGPLDLRTTVAECPRWYAELILAMTKRDPGDRLATGAEALGELRSVRPVKRTAGPPAIAVQHRIRPPPPSTVSARVGGHDLSGRPRQEQQAELASMGLAEAPEDDPNDEAEFAQRAWRKIIAPTAMAGGALVLLILTAGMLSLVLLAVVYNAEPVASLTPANPPLAVEPVHPPPPDPVPAPAPAPESQPRQDPQPSPQPSSVPLVSAPRLVEQGWNTIDVDPTKALSLFEASLAIVPSADAYYGKGYALVQLARLDEARLALCEARRRADPATRREIGAVMADQGFDSAACPLD